MDAVLQLVECRFMAGRDVDRRTTESPNCILETVKGLVVEHLPVGETRKSSMPEDSE